MLSSHLPRREKILIIVLCSDYSFVLYLCTSVPRLNTYLPRKSKQIVVVLSCSSKAVVFELWKTPVIDVAVPMKAEFMVSDYVALCVEEIINSGSDI